MNGHRKDVILRHVLSEEEERPRPDSSKRSITDLIEAQVMLSPILRQLQSTDQLSAVLEYST